MKLSPKVIELYASLTRPKLNHFTIREEIILALAVGGEQDAASIKKTMELRNVSMRVDQIRHALTRMMVAREVSCLHYPASKEPFYKINRKFIKE